MNKKVAALWLSLTLLLSFIVIIVEIVQLAKATIIYVPTDFAKIQDAINASKDGDTVFVYSGTYYENLIINKSINLTGEDRDTTIINASKISWYVDVIKITADWVNITNLSITGGEDGISVEKSSNHTISNNNVSRNYYAGIRLWLSFKNNIYNNVLYNSRDGISLASSNENLLFKNTISNNGRYGIDISYSNANSYMNNSLVSNGIDIVESTGQCFINNSIENDGFFIRGYILEHWDSHDIPITNTINGKSIYYWKNQSGGVIPGNAGQVILANCSNVKIENKEITNTFCGILLGFSNNNTITNNNASMNRRYGIYLYYSNGNNINSNNVSSNFVGIFLDTSNNNWVNRNNANYNTMQGILIHDTSNDNNITNNNASSNYFIGIHLEASASNNITGNTVNSNIYAGIFLVASYKNYIVNNNISFNKGKGVSLDLGSNSNKVFHNNFINNKVQGYDDSNMNNQWDNGYPSGGNFWSDYTGIDRYRGPDQNIPGNDGIGDTNYSIDSDSVDNYPLMAPIGNCIFLYEGWNLVSIPFIQPDTNLGSVLSSITGDYDTVQWYNVSDGSDPWKHNSSLKPPQLNDLKGIDHTMGFWIHIIRPNGTLFDYPGIQPTENKTITLHPGWNLVGYPSLIRNNRTHGLNNLTFDTHVDSIWIYNSAAKKWQDIREMDHFLVGKGYWVHAITYCMWQVPI
jgi:parallel beta-helix repeat protein